MQNELRNMMNPYEEILYEGKPDKMCYVLEGIFNRNLPFALMWACFDLFFLSGILKADDNARLMKILFVLVHMMPVWIYLWGVISTFLRYVNTDYIVTDRAVYVSSGGFNVNCQRKAHRDCVCVELERGHFDRLCRAGDLIVLAKQETMLDGGDVIKMSCLSDYRKVYSLLEQLQEEAAVRTGEQND